MEKRLLIARWLESNAEAIPIYDEASVSTARQRVREAGERLGANKTLIESAALVASELTHNQLAYARQGYFAVRPIERAGVKGLEVIAADIGPGLQKALFPERQVVSKTSLGAGLEGVFRISDEVHLETRSEEGVCVVARKFEKFAGGAWEIAVAGRPLPGESISGDDACFIESEDSLLAIVADGLGHGPDARQASHLAMHIALANRGASVGALIPIVASGLAGTRGCALSVVQVNTKSGDVECAAAGDVHVHLYNGRDTHFFTSTPFVVGDSQFSKRKLRIENIKATPGCVLLLFTDGLQSKTTLKGDLDLLRRPAIAIAQHLIATYARPNDDALVLVARWRK
jgi:anti-sigma regulatory factor (Ser/Thr protein kinase)